jgi:putative membrane protein
VSGGLTSAMGAVEISHREVPGGPALHKGDDATSLAVSRTMLAHDRTLMAWVRTATSMISFGFTLYKFFQYLEDGRTASHVDRLVGPRGVALLLISIGIGALLFATLDYRQQMAALRERYRAYGPFHGSIVLAVATMVAGLGVLGFVVVFLRQ